MADLAACDAFALNRRDLLLALVAGAAQATIGLSGDARAQRVDELNNPQILLCVIGMLQPASIADVHSFLENLYLSAGRDMRPRPARPQFDAIGNAVQDLARTLPPLRSPPQLRQIPLIAEVQSAPVPRFSLTAGGNAVLSDDLRHLRDRTRLFLLKGPRRPILDGSRGEGNDGTGGASPSNVLSSTIESISQPTRTRSATVPRWVELNAVFETGPVSFPRDAPLNLLSFANLDQLFAAGGNLAIPTVAQPIASAATPPEAKISWQGIALCLGVSWQLLEYIVINLDDPARFYRIFNIPKRSGGERTIQSPRLFLKIMQRFVLDFLLPSPNPNESGAVHSAVHSFRRGRSVVSNAQPHREQPYLARLDIKDFFGSIPRWNVRTLFREHSVVRDKALEYVETGEGARQSRVLQRGVLQTEAVNRLARLCTIADVAHPQGVLPQGAPTSPMLSNLMLAQFDSRMSDICGEMELAYTRYADDIAISGTDSRAVRLAFQIARHELLRPPRRMQVNVKKNRVTVTRGERQMVTGVVVNKLVLPPREFRRRVRAAFHQADRDEARLAEQAPRLRGYLSYLSSFRDFPPEHRTKYEAILARAPKR